MIDRFIELIENYNTTLEAKINESNIFDQINNVLTNLGSKEISTSEMEQFNKAISKLDLEESSRQRLPFILFLLKNNKALDETQSAVLYEISRKIPKPDNSATESLLEKNKKVVEELKNGKTFENIEDLIIVFNELEGAEGIRINTEFKLGVIKEIIIKNHENMDKVETNITNVNTNESEDEYVEKEVSADQKMSAEELKAILEKYGYSYDSLSDDNKAYLSKYAYKERVIEVLETLKEYNIFIKTNKSARGTAFCKILVLSNVGAIKEFITLCIENNIDPYEFIKDVPSIIVPNKVKRRKQIGRGTGQSSNDDSVQGLLGNFKENIKYLKENGYDIAKINADRKAALGTNPETLKYNLETLSDIYGISMKDGSAFSAVINGTAIEKLDQIIESCEYGYEYAKTNKSKISTMAIIELFKIRIAEDEHSSLFYYWQERANSPLVKYSDHGKSLSDPRYANDRRLQILKMSDSEVIRKFGRKIPVYIPDDQVAAYEIMISNFEIHDFNVESNRYIAYLDSNYKENEYVYKINGTYISRKKVLRICQSLVDNNIKLTDSIMKFAISYNSILNENDINNITSINFGMNLGGMR